MLRVGIRTDGSRQIGMGHVMRCLSLAKEFKNAGCAVSFLCKYDEGIKKIKEQGFETIKLKKNSVYDDSAYGSGSLDEFKLESEEIVDLIKKYVIDILLVDKYNVTEDYFLKIKLNVRKLGYIDDLCRFIYPVDILINGNITGEYMNYKRYSEKETLFLGPRYNLIRDEFRDIPKRVINKNVNTILVTTGGADMHDMTSNILNMILTDERTKHLKIHVIVGTLFKKKKKLFELGVSNDNIILHENVSLISKIMLEADVAVTAGGGTMYELCACGTPALSFIYADNQVHVAEAMDRLGYIKSLGWHDRLEKDELCKSLDSLCRDYGGRKILSRKMQSLVDGKGAQRIVETLLKNFYT